MQCRKLLFVTIALIFITGNHAFGMELVQTNQQESNLTIPNKKRILFLNGLTTSGKSTITEKLAATFKEQSVPVEVFALDTFMVPKVQQILGITQPNSCNAVNLDPITPLSMKEIYKKSQTELCAAARVAYEQGKTVIIDAPACRHAQIVSYQQALTGLEVVWVLIYCPISKLVERVIKRNETSNIVEQRSVLQALDQFSNLYSSATPQPVDTLSRRTLYAACYRAQEQHVIMQESIPDFLKNVQQAICPFDINIIQNTITLKCALDYNHEAKIGPVIEHDCVVNTENHNFAVCAQKIIECILCKTEK